MKRIALAAALGLAFAASAAHAVGHLADVTLTDRTSGRELPVYWHDGQAWVAGTPGHEYLVNVRNREGRDVLARVLATGRGSLLLVVAAIVVATIAGSVIGVVVGFAGGRFERVGVGVLRGWAAFPGELVALVLLAFNGRSGVRSASRLGLG